jgi:rod shape-determining protein MreD
VTQEVSVARKALTAIILAIALFAAVVIQLTVVNRLPLPGAAAPDLVLLLVAAIAVATGPATGAVTGFAGGLALDIAPPAAHYAGEYALVFCLVGYAAARVVRAVWDMTGEHDPVATFTVMAVAVAAGEAGKAALGILLSNPDVTTAAVTRVLPAAILYDLLLSPLVYWLVVRVTRGAVGWRAAQERAPAPEFGALQPASVFRQASAGAAPKLRLAGTGESYGSPSPARRVPKLRLSGARTAASLRTTAAGSPGAPLSLAGGRTMRLNFAGSRQARTARPVARTPGKNWLRSPASPAVPAAKRAVHSPSRGWLSAAGAAGSPGGQASGRARARPRRFAHGIGGTAHAASSPVSARPARSAGEALAARSAPSGVSALSGAGTPLARRRSPSRGWLRASGSAAPTFSRQRRAPRSGWLGSASRPRTVIGSGVGGRSGTFRRGTFRQGRTARGNWYTASPSGAWLRRGRHPWRKRLHLPGGRPPVPPGARAMAKGAVVSRARGPRLFGMLGGRR